MKERRRSIQSLYNNRQNSHVHTAQIASVNTDVVIRTLHIIRSVTDA